MSRLLIEHIGLLATPQGRGAAGGAAQGQVLFLKDAYILCENGRIAAIGQGAAPACDAKRLDAQGKLVTPGLIDAHTHLIFGGWRQHELADKLRGKSYLDILREGGGIHETVRATRQAAQQALTEKAEKALRQMLRGGVTTCEAKSGYGLDRETELRQLRVIRALDARQPVELAATFLGAHAVPKEYAEHREDYVRLLCEQLIPQVAREGLAEFCDVFCEEGVFTAEESRRILQAGRECGLKPKIHADEIAPIGGSQLAGALRAVSAEHLIVCPPEGIAALRDGGVVACLLPATSFYLGASYAPAQQMLRAGVPIAVASDFNPGSCPGNDLHFCMNLACLRYRMTPEQVLTAVTRNAAAALCRDDRLGTLEAGKQADLVLWDAPDLDYLCYRLGGQLAQAAIKRGEVAYTAEF